MFQRWTRYATAEAAPAAPIQAAAPAPAAEAPPAWATALMAKVDLLEGAKTKLEADVSAKTREAEENAKAKLTLEERVVAIDRQLVSEKVEASLAKEFSRHSYTHPSASDHALAVFRATHRVEMKDGAAIATGPDGKPQHLKQAAESWLKGPGAMYLAAPAQPGAGAPSPASPDGRAKGIADMSKAEFDAALAGGMRVRLTNDPRSPIVTIRRKTNPYDAFKNNGGAASAR